MDFRSQFPLTVCVLMASLWVASEEVSVGHMVSTNTTDTDTDLGNGTALPGDGSESPRPPKVAGLVIISPCLNVRCAKGRVCIVNREQKAECVCKPGTKKRGKKCVKYGPSDPCSACPKYSFCYKELAGGVADCLCIDGHSGDNCRSIEEFMCEFPCANHQECVLNDAVCTGRLPQLGAPCYNCVDTDPCSKCPKYSRCLLPPNSNIPQCPCIRGHFGDNCERVDLFMCGDDCTEGRTCTVDTSVCNQRVPTPGPPCYKCVDVAPDPCLKCPKYSSCLLPSDSNIPQCPCIKGHFGGLCERVDLFMCGDDCTEGRTCTVDTSVCNQRVPTPGPPCYKCIDTPAG